MMTSSPPPTRKPSAEPERAPLPMIPQIDPNEKLLRDLGVVMEKVRLCREMLPVSPGIARDEALAEVVGFLEACRDRMFALGESGSRGELNEVVFEEVFKVNDALLKTLDAERTGMIINVDEETNPSKAPEKVPDNFFADFDNSFPSSGGNAKAPAPATATAQVTDNLLEIDAVTPEITESWAKMNVRNFDCFIVCVDCSCILYSLLSFFSCLKLRRSCLENPSRVIHLVKYK